MSAIVTSKGRITIPKHIHDSMHTSPGCKVDFQINKQGKVEMVKEGAALSEKELRFRSVIGSATIKWDTDELMKLLRGED
jgi:antitoxin PrlF